MEHFIVNVSGLSPNEKQAVNKALAKITGCKEMECQSAKAIFFYAPCPAMPGTISWDYDQHERKPTHTPQEIIAMAEQLNTKRKVRADFDKSQPVTVNVSGCTEDIKRQVQQAFFDIGYSWYDEGRYLIAFDHNVNSYRGSEHKNLCWSRQSVGITPAEFFAMVYEDDPQGHPHAELMMQYAEDAKTHSEPWKLWEVSGIKGRWDVLLKHPQWIDDMLYRRKPKTHLVHGVEVPDLRVKPKRGESYYYPYSEGVSLVSRTTFVLESRGDAHRLQHNLCYEDTEAGKQAAILHAKIMLGIA